MSKLDDEQTGISNQNTDWAKHYDYYEIELREVYQSISKPQNDSHNEMLKWKGAKYIRKDKIACEIGFGAGHTLRFYAKHFGTVYGLDISPKNVKATKNELAQEGFKNVELYSSDLMIYDERFENKFDVITFIHGLEHFSSNDYPIILNNIKKYLNPGGIFTGALPFHNHFNYRMCPKCNHVFEIDGHVSSHNKETLSRLFVSNEFQILHLDNSNIRYAIKQGSLAKRLYRLIMFIFVKSRSLSQLEFIVKN